MLRVLSGLQRGWFGRLHLPAAFLEELGELAMNVEGRASARH